MHRAEERENKQANKQVLNLHFKMWFMSHGFYGKINKFPFQGFGVSVGKKDKLGFLDDLTINSSRGKKNSNKNQLKIKDRHWVF